MIHKQLPCYPLICCFLLLLGCTQNQEIQPPQSQQNIERAVRPVAQVIAPDQRQALVIGNSEYTHAGVLRNPVNDAQAISDTLRQLDFEVMTLTNASQREMEQSIRDFGKNLQGRNGVGLFFYAGHGMQIDGENYLLPIDIDPVTEEDVRYDAVPLGRLLGQMRSSGNQMNLIVLDACRNNPFARSFRSSSKGLAQVIAPTGSFISYATAPGQVAADGEGDNGLFTAKLLDHMKTPGLKLEDVFKQVRVDVQQESNNRQVPWDSSSLTGDFYFVSPKTEKKIIVSEDKPREQTTANSDTSSTFIQNSTTNYCEDVCDGLVAYYPFAGDANDYSGNGFHGSVIGAQSTSDRNGIPDKAYSFSEHGFIAVNDFDAITEDDEALSIVITTKLFAIPIVNNSSNRLVLNLIEGIGKDRKSIFSLQYNIYDASLVNRWQIEMVANQNTEYETRITSQQSDVDPLKYNQILGTFDWKSNFMKIYVNGNYVIGDFISNDVARKNPDKLLIGIDSKLNQSLDGIIDEIRIYNRILSNNEIKQLSSKDI